jgi:uncharacterized protein GlcG (DUF336 family)
MFVAAALVGAALLGATGLGTPSPSSAAPSPPPASKLPTAPVLPLRLAQRAAEAAIKACREKGYPVAATVVDAGGAVIAQLRSDGTAPVAIQTTMGKANAAAQFRTPTDQLAKLVPSTPGLAQVPGFILLPGGLPIISGNDAVGGIGVGGAPSPDLDAACAEDGLKAIAGDL